MAEQRTRPPPGSAPPGLLGAGIGALLVGVAAAVVGGLAMAGVLDLSTLKTVALLVVALVSVLLGSASTFAWVKFRPRKGTPRTEWHPPQSSWQKRFDSSRAFTAFLAIAWIYFLIGTIRSTTRPMTDDTVLSIVIGIGFVLVLTWSLVKRWRRRRSGDQAESSRPE